LIVGALLAGAPATFAKITEEGNLKAGCGDGKPAKGTKQLYKATDEKGQTFILNCVDNTYFEGRWIHDGKEEVLGKCVFDEGLNDQSFFTDENGDFTRIVWVNVEPKGIKMEDIKENGSSGFVVGHGAKSRPPQ